MSEEEEKQKIQDNIKHLQLEKLSIDVIKLIRSSVKELEHFDSSDVMITIPSIVFQVMKIVEKNKTLSGDDKRDLVIMCIDKVLDENIKDNEPLKMLISSTIELIVTVSKDKDFNKKIKKCFTSCVSKSKK